MLMHANLAVNARRTPAWLLWLINRIKSRTSRETAGRPGLPRLMRQVQNKRKPFRCQPTTVSALHNH